ncbi:MAG: hypothetical protein BEN18_06635 [Epulopiscium sp. Nuni2H_MBin001]|nr:MAG: hypothetical protein BEN18_06635 [Epulopiscium sp. Nuni2H_MBin001]
MNVVFVIYVPKEGLDIFFELYQDQYEQLEAKRKELIRLPKPDDKWGGLSPIAIKVDDEDWFRVRLDGLLDYPILRISIENILSLLHYQGIASKLETISFGIGEADTVLDTLHYQPEKELVVELNCDPDSPWLNTYEIGYRLQFPNVLLNKFYTTEPVASLFYPVGTIDDIVVLEYTCKRHPEVGRAINKILYQLLVNTSHMAILTTFLEDKTILESTLFEYAPGYGVTLASLFSYVPAIEQPIKLLD